jgi:tRNA(adenine34) deaminase
VASVASMFFDVRMDVSETDDRWMVRALVLAAEAAEAGEVPVGAVVVRDGEVLAVGRNTREGTQDPCGHAEVNALREAARVAGTWRLDGCTIYVTLEPCAMCAGAMVLARITRCVYATTDPKGGFLGTLGNLADHPGLNHHFEVASGTRRDEARAQLQAFFADRRRKLQV